jgi:hypothetical protein
MSSTMLVSAAVSAELVLSWIVPWASFFVVLTVVGVATYLPDHPAAVRVRPPSRDL